MPVRVARISGGWINTCVAKIAGANRDKRDLSWPASRERSAPVTSEQATLQ
jgi:hypothetical protein